MPGVSGGVTVELAFDAHANTGESPTWCPGPGLLFWIDVKAPALHRFDPRDGSGRRWDMPAEIGCMAATADGEQVLVGLRTGLFAFAPATESLTRLADPPFDPRTHRFNEGGCDATGRFWLGTMFEPEPGVAAEPSPGALHSFRTGEGLRRHRDASLEPNGMGWSPDNRTMYLAHSREQRVLAFPFDAVAARLGEPGDFVSVPKSLGVPDGAAVDEEGCYWLAIHGGGRLRRYRPDGRLDLELMLPVSNPTMCAFAGATLDTLFITTASHGKSDEAHAGGLFRCRPGIRGLPCAGFAG